MDGSVLQRRHERHPAPLPRLLPHMFPQQPQDLAIAPPSRDRSVRRLESTHGLGPLARAGIVVGFRFLRPVFCTCTCSQCLQLYRTRRSRRSSSSTRINARSRRNGGLGAAPVIGIAGRRGGERRVLRRPVVDVPVVLVEEEVQLRHLRPRHAREVRLGEGREEEIRF